VLMQLNSFLTNPGDVSDKNSLIRHNRDAIERSYNQKQYGRNLRNIYERVANTEVKQSIDKKVLISTFLNLEKFSLLKWSDYVE
jgi:methionine aminopeptidase